MTGMYAHEVRSNLKGVSIQFVDARKQGIALSMDYLEALQLAQALVNAACRHGEIAQKQAQNIVAKMNKRVAK